MNLAKLRLAAWSDARIGVFVFLASWLTYGFLAGDFQNSNSVTRMGLIFAIIDHHSLQLGEFARLTVDKALIDGTYYADKTPGQSFTALPFVAVLVWAARALGFAAQPVVDGRLSSFYAVATFVATFFTSGLFTALAAAVVYRLARHWQASRAAALYGALGFAVATPMLGWASVLFAHAMAGACLFIAFAGIVLGAEKPARPRRDAINGLLTGVLLGWAAVVEPTAAPAAAMIGAFGLWTLRRIEPRRQTVIAATALLGALVGLLAIALYNAAAYGSAFHIGYENSIAFPGHHQGLMGVSWPRPEILYELIFGGYRGILWFAPLVAAAPFGYWAAFRVLPIATALTLLGVPVAYFLAISGFVYWSGGWTTGPRFVVPSLPFLILPLALLWQRCGEGARLALLGLAVVSAADALVCASVSMITPARFANPLLDFIFPIFVGGGVRDLLTYAGLGGPVTLAAIPLLWVALAAILAATARTMPAASPRPLPAAPAARAARAKRR